MAQPPTPSQPPEGAAEHEYAASYLRTSDPASWAKHVLERHRSEQTAAVDRRYGRRSILLGAAFTLLGVVIGLVGSFVATDLTNSAYDDRDKRDFLNSQKATAFGEFDTSINTAVGTDFDVYTQFTSSTVLTASATTTAMEKVRDRTLAIRNSEANVEIFGSAKTAGYANSMFTQAITVQGDVVNAYACQIVSPDATDEAKCAAAKTAEQKDATTLISMQRTFVALAKSELGVG